MSDSETDDDRCIDSKLITRPVRTLIIVMFVANAAIATIATPAIAAGSTYQSSGSSSIVCDGNPDNGDSGADKIHDMIEGAIRLMTGLGVVGFIAAYQANRLVDILPLRPDQQKKLKQQRRKMMGAAGSVLMIGPMYEIGAQAMNLPIPQCITLIPW